ncbi:TIR domain-containing protein [Verrucomicrobiota bacterium sgz303538]
MSYRNKTYVIFDGDNDMWAYAYMIGWKENDNIEFNFHNAHDLKPIRDGSSDETVYRRLRERFSSGKQVIAIIGENTKNLYKFVRWELEIALKLDLPIIAVNLNGNRECDRELCPPIIRDEYVVHVPFKRAIIQHALDKFPEEYARRSADAKGPRHYNESVYKKLGL